MVRACVRARQLATRALPIHIDATHCIRWNEHPLNIAAAVAQLSKFTHVELAIGTDSGLGGEMCNVARVFNDPCGVVSMHLELKNGQSFNETATPF